MDLEYYRRQPYERLLEIREEAGQRYLLYRIKQIRAIAADGPTKDEALANLRRAFDDYIAWALEEGLEIPKPEREVQGSSRALETRSVLVKAAENVAHDAVRAELKASEDLAFDDAATSGPATEAVALEKVA
jgi:predicted RNase H-like HicB family nuclease